MRRPGVAFLLTVLAAGPAAAQRIELIDDATLPRFEVASVRRGDPNAPPGRVDFPPGRFVQENVPLLNALSLAFDLRSYQMTGPFPDLVTREPFTIDARMPAASTGRPVVDQTGLTATFDIEMQWSFATSAGLGRGDSTGGEDLGRSSRHRSHREPRCQLIARPNDGW